MRDVKVGRYLGTLQWYAVVTWIPHQNCHHNIWWKCMIANNNYYNKVHGVLMYNYYQFVIYFQEKNLHAVANRLPISFPVRGNCIAMCTYWISLCMVKEFKWSYIVRTDRDHKLSSYIWCFFESNCPAQHTCMHVDELSRYHIIYT